jgi:mRNA interferase HicA
VTRDQLIRRLRKLARKQGIEFRVDFAHGKGSHAALYFGSRVTICPDGELKSGTLSAVLKDLGIDRARL